MNVELFIKSLTETEYLLLEKIVLQRLDENRYADYLDFIKDKIHKENIEGKRIRIVDYIKEYSWDLNNMCIKLLNLALKDFEYIDELYYPKLRSYNMIGDKTITQLEYNIKRHLSNK